MITPGQHNFTLYQGTTLRKTFTWTADNVPVNLTGYTGRSQFRATYQDPTPALNMTTLNGGIIINELAGEITMFASAEDTALLTADRYLYDLELIDSIGDVSRLIYGTVTIVREITK